MAKSMAVIMKQEEAERKAREKRWRAESDADALIRANEVKMDKERAKMAKEVLAEQQKQNVLRAQASTQALTALNGKQSSKSSSASKGKATANSKAPSATKKQAQPKKASANKKQTKKGGK